MVNKKTFKKYQDLINGDLWTEQQIISFRSYLNNGLRHEPEHLAELVTNFQDKAYDKEYELTREQQLKGIEWLKRTQLNKKGELRRAKSTFLQQQHIRILEQFSHFTMTGLYNAARPYSGFFNSYNAMYKCYDYNGNWFIYTVTNIGFEVLSDNVSIAA